MTDAITTGEALRQALAPRRVALVVGVDHYDDPSFPALRHAVADADAIAALMSTKEAGFDQVRIELCQTASSRVLNRGQGNALAAWA